ncbi:MAG: hypothetical protein Unbinned5081contig1003_51 [Prokaryotic dsDNA virus sp.]|nr:MAG: hypothetical protein Unbinned5081contig1003_51 [Prokaryotic dsDNA virus sp.]
MSKFELPKKKRAKFYKPISVHVTKEVYNLFEELKNREYEIREIIRKAIDEYIVKNKLYVILKKDSKLQ